MKIIAKYGIRQLVNCLNMTCQNAARMTMLEKGTCLQWRPLVYSDQPNIAIGFLVDFIGSIYPGLSYSVIELFISQIDWFFDYNRPVTVGTTSGTTQAVINAALH